MSTASNGCTVLFMPGHLENIYINRLKKSEIEEYESKQRNLYYIALTRAMDILNIFTLSSNAKIKYIADLKECMSKVSD